MDKEVFTQEIEENFNSLEDIIQEGMALYEKREFQEEKQSFIVFRLSRECYAVEVSKVKEIIKRPKITSLPCSPDYISGVINFRGEIISVTNLRGILDLPKNGDEDGTKIIVIEFGSLETGLLVDEVIDCVEVEVNQIKPLPHTLPDEKGKLLKGVWKWGERWVALLRVEKILEGEIGRRNENGTMGSIF